MKSLFKRRPTHTDSNEQEQDQELISHIKGRQQEVLARIKAIEIRVKILRETTGSS